MPSSHHPVLRPLIIKKGAENSLSPNTKIPPARRFYASLCVKSIVLQQYLPPLESRTAPGYHFKRAPYILFWEISFEIKIECSIYNLLKCYNLAEFEGRYFL